MLKNYYEIFKTPSLPIPPLIFNYSGPENAAFHQISGLKSYVVSNAETVKLENTICTQFLCNHTWKIHWLMKRKEHMHLICANFMHTVYFLIEFNFPYTLRYPCWLTINLSI